MGPPPPLVVDLFSTRYDATLARYPLALQAAADIRQATQGDQETAVPLERFLRERMRDSGNPYTQRRYRQVPMYLQDVMFGASHSTSNPANYNALLNAALELDSVLFLTLNYDTLLDDCLAAYTPREDLDWYTKTDERWALIKLHGSVDWAYPLPLDEGVQHAQTTGWANKFLDDFPEMPPLDSDRIVYRHAANIEAMRLSGGSGTGEANYLYYPALAVPLGEEDELVCRADHLDEARRCLRDADGLNVLVIGYSGIDREVLRLLRESENKLRRLLVVNGSSGERALQTGQRITQALKSDLPEESLTELTFTQFVEGGSLRRWFDALD